MKKKILYVAAIVICLSLITGGTFAYYTASETVQNIITSGGIHVAVEEFRLVDGELEPYPSEPIPMMPGETVSKIVTAESSGEDAWVRMNYVITVYDAQGEVMEIAPETLAEIVTVDADATAWTFQDGWWYYNAPLLAGERTTPLFEQVSFVGTKMGNEYQLCTVVIDVTVQAVQKANNGESVLDAAGWPAD